MGEHLHGWLTVSGSCQVSLWGNAKDHTNVNSLRIGAEAGVTSFAVRHFDRHESSACAVCGDEGAIEVDRVVGRKRVPQRIACPACKEVL